jgi:DNA mismatch endonuclease (patch repair protein)
MAASGTSITAPYAMQYEMIHTMVFVHGCFWHKHNCSYFKWPKSNTEFWSQKIEGNVQRDTDNYLKLTSEGWEYFVIWECELKTKDLKPVWIRLKAFIDS